MNNNKEKKELEELYLEQGYLILPINDLASLDNIRRSIFTISRKIIGDESNISPNEFFNNIHKQIEISNINEFRIEVIKKIELDDNLRKYYYSVAKQYLDIIVGNELAMQKRLNLSIQIPMDSSSLLPIHADTWSGDSPFEVVQWLPLVDCFKTKSMYILPKKYNKKFNETLSNPSLKNSSEIFNLFEDKFEWLNIKYGEVLIFNQGLPHGNINNAEIETR